MIRNFPKHRPSCACILLFASALFLAPLFVSPPAFSQATGGSISGSVTDPSGGVVPGVTVTAINLDTTVQQTTSTNAEGFYAFPNLAVGRYEIQVQLAGFQSFRRTGLVLDIGTQLRSDVTLAVNTQSTQVVVTAQAAEVQPETQQTQMGETIPSVQVESVPLNGRAYTDILNVQAGVIPVTTQSSANLIMAGVTSAPPSGNQNPGNVSVNGQPESANGFVVNGADVEEDVNLGTAVIPNLESIDEFRILTNNFDAKYGNFSGGLVIVSTKSGTNVIHGDVFDFVRNTALDAKDFFATSPPAYDQQQFGGTVGGHIKKNKAFWFVDYQGTRTTDGIDTGVVTVPSLAERGGGQPGGAANLSDLVGTPNALSGNVSTTYIAHVLATELGRPVSVGEAYTSVFPGNLIPQSVWSAPAQALLNYFPTPNVGTNTFDSASENQTIRDDKGGIRLDLNTQHWGNFVGYYFADNANVNSPYAYGQGGANVPSGLGGAFNSLTVDYTQLLSLGDVKTFGNNWVNEAHFSYLRNNQVIGTPSGGVGTSLICQGFDVASATDPLGSSGCTNPTGTANVNSGIYPVFPAIEGIENTALENMGVTIGVPITNSIQVANVYQWLDNVTHIVGTHTITFGGEFHLDQVNEHPNATGNGSFQFAGSETGSDFADYLLGIASNYVQADEGAFYPRDHYLGFFGQDSWRVTRNLTLNYGLRYEIMPLWREKNNQLSAIVPGEQSLTWPGAPVGFVVPGDPGIPDTIAKTSYHNFAPRVGLAYAPDFQNSILRKILGKNGQSSIRAGFGIMYTAIPTFSPDIEYTIAPYAYNYVPGEVLFADPMCTTSDVCRTNPFPTTIAPYNTFSPSNPNPRSWANYEPIDADPSVGVNATNTPYTEEFFLSFQRQFTNNLLLSVSYVGSQSHHQLSIIPFNSGNPTLCATLNANPATPCGPNNEALSRPFCDPQMIDGAEQCTGFGGDSLQETLGNSNYNGLEAVLRYSGREGNFLASYTYSKCLTTSSAATEEVLSTDLKYTYALCSFDIRHNFVITYRYNLPIWYLFGDRHNRFTEGWSLSGTTRFATGLPVTILDSTDNSELGTNPNGVNNNYIDRPNCAAGSLNINTKNPNLPVFNTSLFSQEQVGQLGDCPLADFSGPGLVNFDMTLAKNLRLTESKSLEFRLEAFNVFNTPQFFISQNGLQSVEGNFSDSDFGQIVGSMPARIVQLGAKFIF